MLTENEIRCHYFSDMVGGEILKDPTAFYEAFENGEDDMASLWTAWWETLCERLELTVAQHPFFPDTEVYILEDTEEGFCALVTVALPKTANASSLSAAIVFGSAMDPRVFFMRPVMLKNGEAPEIVEYRADGAVSVGVMYRGCDNGMQLFDAPNPQKIDRTTPLDPARRADAFVDAVVCWCLAHD